MSTDAGTGAFIMCSIAPMLSVRNGARAVEFYKAAFGAIEVARTIWPMPVTVVIAFVALCVPAGADPFPDCAERAYSQSADASREWQRDLRDLIAKVRPDLATLATLAMEDQRARIERRQAQFRYLLDTDVRRVNTGNGLVSFRNFDWTEADARVLRTQSADYVAIERKVEDLKRQSQARRDWPAMHDFVRTSLSTGPQFQDLLKRFRAREGEIERLLESCQPSP